MSQRRSVHGLLPTRCLSGLVEITRAVRHAASTLSKVTASSTVERNAASTFPVNALDRYSDIVKIWAKDFDVLWSTASMTENPPLPKVILTSLMRLGKLIVGKRNAHITLRRR